MERVSITLLSDLGLQDASIAIAKGILLQYMPHALITDITHEVIPYFKEEATYLLGSCYQKFPAGTYHIVLFEMQQKEGQDIMVSEYDGHYFVSSGNDLIQGIFPDSVLRSWTIAPGTGSSTEWLHTIAKTIMNAGNKPISETGLKNTALNRPVKEAIKEFKSCDVIHIDEYENIVLNIRQQDFTNTEKTREMSINIMNGEEITSVNKHYSDVRPGNKLARFNSGGYLELCVNKGKAASLFGIRVKGEKNNIAINTNDNKDRKNELF